MKKVISIILTFLIAMFVINIFIVFPQTIPISFFELRSYPVKTTTKYHPVAKIGADNYLLPRKDAASGFGGRDYLVYNRSGNYFTTIDSNEATAKGLYEIYWTVTDCISLNEITIIAGILDYYIPKLFININGIWGKWNEVNLTRIDTGFGYNEIILSKGENNDLYLMATTSNFATHFYYSYDKGNTFTINHNMFTPNRFKHYRNNSQVIEKGLIYNFNHSYFFKLDFNNNKIDSVLILDTTNFQDYYLFDLHFKDKDNGVVLAYKNFPFSGVVGKLNLRVFETSDGGQSFKEKANVDMPRPITTDIKKVYTNGDILQYYNDTPFYFLSTDFGKTWEYYDYSKDLKYPGWIYKFIPIEDGKKYFTYSWVNTYEVTSIAVSIDNEIIHNTNISPNPVSNYAQLKLDNDFAGIASISVVDLLGNSTVIFKGEISGKMPLDLDFSSFPTGFYYLIIDYGMKREVVKVIKE